MTTACNQKPFAFHHLGRREIVAHFDGGLLPPRARRISMTSSLSTSSHILRHRCLGGRANDLAGKERSGYPGRARHQDRSKRLWSRAQR